MRSPPRRDSHGGAPRRSPSEEESTRRVYVHNLSYKTSWQDLKDYMRKAGAVEHVRVMEDRYGRSLGCAIVEYATREDALRSIKELNDTTFEEGRSVLVREDRESGNRRNPPYMGGRGGYGGGARSGGHSSRDSIGLNREGNGPGAYLQVYGNGATSVTAPDEEYCANPDEAQYGGAHERNRTYPGYERHDKSNHGDRYRSRSRSRSRSPRRRGGRTKEQLDMELDGFQKNRKESKVPRDSSFEKQDPGMDGDMTH